MSFNLFNCYKKPERQLFNELHELLHISQFNATQEVVQIDNCAYYDNLIIEEIDIIYRKISKKWFQLQNMILNDIIISCNDINTIRQSINSSFSSIIKCLKMCNDEILLETYKNSLNKQTLMFSKALIRLNKFEDNVIMNFLYAIEETNPIFQYLHTFYDINLYVLVVFYVCDNYVEFEKRLRNFLQDFLVLHRKQHNRRQNKDISIYNCDCMKIFWLISWCFCETLETGKFWTIFNDLLKNDEPALCLTLLKEIALIKPVNFIDKTKKIEFQTNYQLIEIKIKQLLSSGTKNEDLIYCLQLIEPLVCKLWLKQSKIEVYQILWDYFCKNFNQQTGNKQQNVLSALELVEKFENIIKNPCTCDDSFEIFVGMLLKHLKEYPMHWTKFKGRIFSQLSPNKINNLTNIGISKVFTLLICLHYFYSDEMVKKIQQFIDNLSKDRRNTELVWNFYISLVS